MPETANAAPWIRKEMVCAERSPEVIARRERAEASMLAREFRREERHRERTNHNFYTTERARSRPPIE
jgi:hypothetical protein